MAHINFGKEGEEEGLLLSSIFLQQEQPGITFPELFPLFDGGSITTSSTVSTTTPTTAHYENTASDSDQNNNNNNNNKKKNRPSSSNKRSCDTCRKRKVKCDSNIQHPCTECKKNEIDCEFLALPRKRGRRSKEYIEVLETRLNVLERLLENKLVRRTTKGRHCTNTSNSNGNINKNDEYRQQQLQQLEGLQTSISYTDPGVILQQTSLPPYILQPSQQFIQQPLPTPFIISAHCPRGTAELIQKVPNFTFELAEKTIKSYFEVPHPKWVFIDKHGFLMQFYYQYPRPLEEHLFYAICAVGFQFIPCHDRTQEQLVAAKYLREKAMIHIKNLVFEQSSITTIQTLILMSTLAPTSSSGTTTSITDIRNDSNLNYEEEEEEEENDGVYHASEQVLLRSHTSLFATNWLILGAAIRMCQDMNLHCEPHQSQEYLSKNEIELRRRIAYSVYSLDRMASAVSGKPFMIKDDEFNVGLPTAFEIEPDEATKLFIHYRIQSQNQQHNNNNNYEPSHDRPKLLKEVETNIQEKKPVYKAFLRIIPLSKTMGQVLATLYHVVVPRDIVGCSGSSLSTNTLTYVISNLDDALIKWQSRSVEENCFANDSGILSAVYNTVVLLLYRPLIVSAISANNNNQEGQQKQNQDNSTTDQIQRFCTTVASNIIDWLDTTPVSGTPCFLDYMVGQAASVFVQNYRSTDQAIRIQAQKNLARCANLYQRDEVVNQCQTAIILNQLTAPQVKRQMQQYQQLQLQ